MENKKTIIVNGKEFTIEDRHGDVKINIDGTTFVSIDPYEEEENLFRAYVYKDGYEEVPSYMNMTIDVSSKDYEEIDD